jgi:hypothetical protein
VACPGEHHFNGGRRFPVGGGALLLLPQARARGRALTCKGARRGCRARGRSWPPEVTRAGGSRTRGRGAVAA